LLAAIVSRAKMASVKDELAGGEGGLSTNRLRSAVEVEARQNEEITGATGPDDWARLIGRRGEQIRSVHRIGRIGLAGRVGAVPAEESREGL